MITLVRFKDGISIANVNTDPKFNVAVASANGTHSISTAMKAVQVLNPALHAEESLLTTEKEYFLIRMWPDRGLWLGLGLSLDANLGIARVSINKHLDEVLQNV